MPCNVNIHRGHVEVLACFDACRRVAYFLSSAKAWDQRFSRMPGMHHSMANGSIAREPLTATTVVRDTCCTTRTLGKAKMLRALMHKDAAKEVLEKTTN
jgi:hypothetical protein